MIPPPSMMLGTPQGAGCVTLILGTVSLSFALDLKSEIKRELFYNNVLGILLGKLVGTGSIKISRTVLPGWDPG